MIPFRSARPRSRRERAAARLHARRLWRTGLIVGVAIMGGLIAAGFARLCDGAMRIHADLFQRIGWPVLMLLPAGFGGIAWLTRRFAPEAAGSGIPQVIAAAEHRWRGRWGGQRVTLRTAVWKVALTAVALVCGASIGREGPTVQVVAGVMRTLTRGLKGGAGRRAIIIAGGAAGVAAAFNTPIAGVVFAVEELAKGFDRRTHTTVILVVVVAGFASYALQGNYAYFGVLQSGSGVGLRPGSAAPLVGRSRRRVPADSSRGLLTFADRSRRPIRWLDVAQGSVPVDVRRALCGLVSPPSWPPGSPAG